MPAPRPWVITLFLACLVWGLAASAAPKAVVSVVGPRNLSYLPIDLVPLIGADRAEGLEVQLLHVEGGGLAIKQMISRNSDFTVVGFPALMSLKANGGELVGVMAISDAPQFVLIVRAGLKDHVKRIADLKGRVIGVHTSSVNAKTAAQQLIELLLAADGINPHEARVVSTGQKWEERALLLESGKVDAIVAEEPFASTLLQQGKVFFLANLAEPETTRAIAGANFLHAALATRADVVANQADTVERLVKSIRRSLAWIAGHSPQDVVERLGVTDPREKEGILLGLSKYPRLFSQDGKFSRRQIEGTNQFFHAVNPHAAAIRMEDLIDDRWVGRKE